MRIIFLDVDGVLNCNSTKERFQGFIGIDDKYVERLAVLVNESSKEEDTQIVLSSSWRLDEVKGGEIVHDALDYVKEKLSKQGLSIYDVTPYVKPTVNYTRGFEIQTWLNDKHDVSSFVVLDDELFWDFKKLKITRHFVQTTFYGSHAGLQDKHIKRALRILRE